MNIINGWLNSLFSPKKLSIRLGQRVVIIGRPNTGKSTFLRWLLKNVKSVVIYDSKYDPDEWPQQNDYCIIGKASELSLHTRVVLQCPLNWLNNSENWDSESHPWSIALEHPIRRRDTIAVFDEALLTWPVRDSHPGTHRLVQQGRSFGVTTIVGSQLANNIDTRLLRMTNHILVLGPCKHGIELDNIQKATQLNAYPLTKLKRHEIAWWSEETDKWIVFRANWIKTKSLLSARNIRFPNQPLSFIAKIGMVGIVIAGLVISFAGILPLILYIILIVALRILMILRKQRWRVEIESRQWQPRILPEEAQVDVSPRKRDAKSFKIS